MPKNSTARAVKRLVGSLISARKNGNTKPKLIGTRENAIRIWVIIIETGRDRFIYRLEANYVLDDESII